MCFLAGLKPAEYYDSCLADAMEMLQAHRQAELNAWQRTREITYWLYLVNSEASKRISKHEFMPLPGDEPEDKRTAMEENIRRWKEAGYIK